MAISTSEQDELVSDINVTPLVDVMLVLLVVFIVTAPLLTNSIKVTLPSTAITSTPEQKESVTVSVDAKGKIYVNKNPVELAQIEPQLKRLHAGNPEVSVHLSADESSNYGLIAKVMSSINRSGVTKLSVLSVGE
jgi:biopolymer transport protein ExbD